MDSTRLTLDLLDDLRQLLEFPFMRNAYAAGTIVALICGVAGYFIVLRGQSFAAHTLSQVGFPGAAGATLLGLPPLYGLVGFCVLAAAAIGALSPTRTEGRRAESAAVASILVMTLALGLLFASLYRGFVDATYSYLFGTFLGITVSQVRLLFGLMVIVLSGFCVIGRPLLFASLEPDVAIARGVPVRGLGYVFLLLVGLSAAGAAAFTGTLLVFALLVTPAATARELTARPARAIVLSVALAIGVTWFGLALAYFSDWPLGFAVTTLAFAAYLVARGARGLRRRLDGGAVRILEVATA